MNSNFEWAGGNEPTELRASKTAAPLKKSACIEVSHPTGPWNRRKHTRTASMLFFVSFYQRP